MLPETVVEVLADPRVFKVGSDILRDAQHDEHYFGIKVFPVFDTQQIHAQVEAELSPTKGLEGHGLGRISFDIFKSDFKPKTAKKYRQKYGTSQPRAWREHAHFSVYEWRKPLSNYARQYRCLDALTPLSLLSWILQHRLQTNLLPRPLVKGPLRDLLKHTASLGEPYYTASLGEPYYECHGQGMTVMQYL